MSRLRSLLAALGASALLAGAGAGATAGFAPAPQEAPLALAPAVLAQQRADAALHVRAEDGVLRAAIVIEVAPGWHLYALDKGPGIGKALEVELGGDGLAWSAVDEPEPDVHQQPALDPKAPPTFVYAHGGTVVLRAAARMAPGASAEEATAKLVGLTCEDGPSGTCIPFAATLAAEGPGPDALFADFPAALVEAVAAAPEDERVGDHADATLYVRRRGDRVLAAVEVRIADGWHLYHDAQPPGAIPPPTRVALEGGGVAWDAVTFPEPETVDQFGGEALVHHGTIVLRAEGAVAGTPALDEVRARIVGQTCEAGPMGVCVPYEETARPRGEGPDALFAGFDEARAEAGSEEPASLEGERLTSIGLGAFLALAVFWGLFTLLMPCTYPMIPITISFFTKQAEARGGRVLALALLYGAGIVAIFVGIGVVLGPAIVAFATHPVTNLVIAALFVVFALALFGLLELRPPRFLMDAAGKASMRGGYLGVFLMGATLVVTSFTCTAPFVGSLLAVGAADGGLTRIVLGMGTFGLTMAVPFVLLSLLPGRIAAMPRSGEWMNTLKVTLGFVELAAALKFLSNADLVWGWRLLSREVFLFAWAAIFAAAAVYLLFLAGGRRARPESGRALGALALLALALYSAWGGAGHDLDRVMTAIAPNYSGGRLAPELWVSGARHTIVVDDYERAREVALAEDKLLLVNFTGHT